MAATAITRASKAPVLTSKGVDVKWSQNTWAKTEARMNDFDLLVLKNLVLAAKGLESPDSHFTVMGEFLYLAVRPLLNSDKMKLLDVAADSRASTPSVGNANQGKNRKGGRKGGGNKQKQGPSKSDLIRMNNSLGTLNAKVEAALTTFHDGGDDFKKPKLFLDKIIELRGVGFLCCAWFLLSKRKKLVWDREMTVLTYSIIVSMERFIITITSLKGKSHLDSLKKEAVASTLATDMSDKLAELKDKFNYDGEELYLNAPQLLIFSEFDKTLPVSTVKPYKHQARICKILEDNLENGFYVLYRAVTNAGKTTTIACLAATVQKIRDSKPDKDILSKLQIVFCCNVNPVKDQAGQWLFNTSFIDSIDNLPFAIAFDKEGKLVIRNSYLLGKRKKDAKEDAQEDDPLVIICSPALALRIFRERGDRPYILFHDEPTIGSEEVSSEELLMNVKLMRRPPRWTILSSATLPSEADMTPFLRRYKGKFTKGHVENVISEKINIGCDVYSHVGSTFLPHVGCATGEALSTCLDHTSENLFLSRSYTPLSVSEMCDKVDENGKVDVPTIGDHFSKIENLNADSVRKFGLDILGKVAKSEDSTVQEICSDSVKCFARKVEFGVLGTTSAYKFPNMTLIASGSPYEFALENFADLLEEIKEEKLYTPEKLIAAHWKLQDQWSSDIEKLKKRRQKPSSKKKDGDDEGEPADYAQQEMDLRANKPFIKFPEYYQINTRLHAEKYSPNGKVSTLRYATPDFSFLTDEKRKMHVSNDMLLLLCCGVGVYAPEDARIKSGAYLEEVVALAQKGRLAYMVADQNIAYGVNFPFSRTIVCKDFSSTHSMNTVFQLMSRAGRVGQSWFAESFVSEDVVRTLTRYSQTNESPDNNMEVRNMHTVARKLAEAERDARLARET